MPSRSSVARPHHLLPALALLLAAPGCRTLSEPTLSLQGTYTMAAHVVSNGTWQVSQAQATFQEATRTFELRIVQQPPAQHLAPQGAIPAGALTIRGTYAIDRDESLDLAITSATTDALVSVPGMMLSGLASGGRVRMDWLPVPRPGNQGPVVTLDLRTPGG